MIRSQIQTNNLAEPIEKSRHFCLFVFSELTPFLCKIVQRVWNGSKLWSEAGDNCLSYDVEHVTPLWTSVNVVVSLKKKNKTKYGWTWLLHLLRVSPPSPPPPPGVLHRLLGAESERRIATEAEEWLIITLTAAAVGVISLMSRFWTPWIHLLGTKGELWSHNLIRLQLGQASPSEEYSARRRCSRWSLKETVKMFLDSRLEPSCNLKVERSSWVH